MSYLVLSNVLVGSATSDSFPQVVANMANLRKVFSKIYDKNVQKIYRFIFLKVNSKDIAKDLTSQTFLQGWEAFEKTKKQKNKRTIENPSAFLYQVARNLVIDFYRKEGRRDVISTDAYDIDLPDPKNNPEVVEAELILNSQMRRVRKALSELEGDYQDVIIWYYLDGLTFSEIGQILDKSEGAVRVQTHRALKKLREELEE